MDISRLLIPKWDSPAPDVEIKTLDNYLTDCKDERTLQIARGIETISSKNTRQKNIYLPVTDSVDLIDKNLSLMFERYGYFSVLPDIDFFGITREEYLKRRKKLIGDEVREKKRVDI